MVALARDEAAEAAALARLAAWADRIAGSSLRRLQLATEAGRTPLLLFRPPAVLSTPSPASLRLRVAAGARGTSLHLHKHQGGAAAAFSLASLQPR
jgi:hypothetical protein